jgi:hypothetical protein
MPSLELEVEHEGSFYTLDMDGEGVTISEATPGMIVEVERAAICMGRVARSDALAADVYDAIERAIQQEVRRRQTQPR